MPVNKVNAMRVRFIYLILAIGLTLNFSGLVAQSAKQTKSQKKVEQKKEERKKNQLKAEKKGREQHMKIQDKDTRKRMKKHKKQTKHPYGKKPNFFQRLFN